MKLLTQNALNINVSHSQFFPTTLFYLRVESICVFFSSETPTRSNILCLKARVWCCSNNFCSFYEENLMRDLGLISPHQRLTLELTS